MSEQSQHGGRREGAGPPRKMEQPQRVTVTLEAAQVEWLKQQAKTVSEAVRAIIEKEQKMATVTLNESGYDTGMTFDEVCEAIEEAGYDSPKDMGYTEQDWKNYDVVFVSADYARSTLLDDGEVWDTEAPYWYGK